MFREILLNIKEKHGLNASQICKESGLAYPDDKSLQGYMTGQKKTFPLKKIEKIFDRFVELKLKN